MDARALKAVARRCGADLAGIVAAGQWADWPALAQPTRIQPRCRSVLVVGRRVLRGALRGVEEGTSFVSTYGTYGQNWNERTFFVRTIHDVALALETAGAEAVPLLGGGTGLDIRRLAQAAGLGQTGKGGFFLTPEYGHRQRLGLILTDAALAGDAPLELKLCDGCDACLRACPLSALTRRDDGDYDLDTRLCRLCANGRCDASPISYAPLDRLAAACGRACLVALEGKIGNRFHTAFRKRATWTRDLNGNVAVRPLETKGVVS